MSSPCDREFESLDDFDDLHSDGRNRDELMEVSEEFWEQLDREVRERCQQKLDGPC
jgi:hypothetical protein